MKSEIHPNYFPEAKVTCACGKSFTVGSTKPELEVEICFNCHPFYTGKDKIIDAIGKVDKFKKRREAAAGLTVVKKSVKRAEKKEKKITIEKAAPKKPRTKKSEISEKQ
ncbi:MAG: 50S ribosomal protein L31 [Candidatus Harrisonbacteria bacterium]|nr:50S ribosomal protein L31 [Candidatus Harrisonbacteria bacterium]